MKPRTDSVLILVGVVITLLAAGQQAPADGQDVTMRFSDAKNVAPTDVQVSVQIQNPDGTWGSVGIPATSIPPQASATQKRDLIKATLQGVFGLANVTDSGANGLNLHVNVDNQIKVKFDPGATGENPDKVVCASTLGGTTSFVGTFNPFDYEGEPAIFTAGIVTDVGELTVEVSAQELSFQTEGPIICQALFQRLAPHAPPYGAQINYAGDRLEVYFDPAYSVAQGGVTFGTTSPSPGCSGEILVPALLSLGACCLDEGLCVQLLASDCAAQGGYYNGDGSSCAGGFGAVPLSPSTGVELRRLDLTFQLAPQPHSAYGLLYADSVAIASYAGFSGYLNMYTAQGWVVRNLPIDPGLMPDGISVLFDAGPYDGIDTISASVVLSPAPQVCFFDPGSEPFPSPPLPWNAEGGEGPRTSPPLFSVSLVGIGFLPLGETSGHALGPDSPPNIEQDTSQCYPAAVANSLQWMEDEYGIDVPHEHRPGIRDDSLVGELDKKMNRPAHQDTPSAIDMVNGKLDYIDENDLADEVDVKHKQRPPINWISGDQTRGDASSYENTDPNTSLFEWICHEIEAGEDVELRIGWDGGGGHMVRITGCGKILGVPYLTWVHDADQGSDPNGPGGVAENGGTDAASGGHGFSFVDSDNKIRCFIEGVTDSATIDFAVSESPTYPPTTPTEAGQPSAATPRYQSRASQYTATRYRAADGFKEDGIYENLYDDPTWENDNKTLKIDNVAVPTNVKEVYLTLVFTAAQANVPNITIQTSSGQAPIQTKTEWRDYNTNLLITWLLPDQPAWEKITFPDDSYFNFTNLKRMGVATYCQRRPDANNNGIDDRQEIIDDPSLDQNQNGIPDDVDFADCNENGLLDILDISSGLAEDCDENGRPDSCDVAFDPGADCNGNLWLDSCETVVMPDIDANGNRVPDECEAPAVCRGDCNCDGVVGFADIDLFVAGIPNNQAAWAAKYQLFYGTPPPAGCWENTNVNAAGTHCGFDDIDPFVKLIPTPCTPRACCFPDHACLDLLPGDCLIAGGTFFPGPAGNQPCELTTCP